MFKLYNQSCLTLPFEDNAIDTVITDPPYGLGSNFNIVGVLTAWLNLEKYDHGNASGFMGQKWDAFVPDPRYWKEALRVLKPGGMAFVFAGSRTCDLMTMSMRLAGYEIRDTIMWVYATGFPKSHDISKAIDRKLGTHGKVIGQAKQAGAKFKLTQEMIDNGGFNDPDRESYDIIAPGSSEAQLWDGWGTALKPAYEPIIVAMKPLDGTYAENAIAYGVAGLNIDGARIETSDDTAKINHAPRFTGLYNNGQTYMPSVGKWKSGGSSLGRWPANLVLDEAAGDLLDRQSGMSQATRAKKEDKRYNSGRYADTESGYWGACNPENTYTDSGGASRFFYCAKSSPAEREFGLDNFTPTKVNDGRNTPIDNAYQRGETLRRNTHPTVKPLSLMRYLARLSRTPTGGIILDNFTGSGTTGMAAILEGRSFYGIELSKPYYDIATRRIQHVLDNRDSILQFESLLSFINSEKDKEKKRREQLLQDNLDPQLSLF